CQNKNQTAFIPSAGGCAGSPTEGIKAEMPETLCKTQTGFSSGYPFFWDTQQSNGERDAKPKT
ncbi:MAG: hypothetical protein QNJ47_13170, partial [Nostocaceae cyanobacterium]|nr:hypothetical protein [Nostocaceae cyanobacterium]